MDRKSGFTKEYKMEIVRLVTELDKKPIDIATEIGVTTGTIRRWVRQYKWYGEGSFPGKGNLRPQDAEYKAMQRQIKLLEEENAILKKAMAIFNKDGR